MPKKCVVFTLHLLELFTISTQPTTCSAHPFFPVVGLRVCTCHKISY